MHPELGSINNEMVCNRDHKMFRSSEKAVHSHWDYLVLSSACLVTSMPMRCDPRLTYRSSLHDIEALSHVVPYFDVSSVCLPRRRQNLSADAVPQVIEYLSKKGYSKTESMLRQESANQDVEGRPINTKAEEAGGGKYGKAFGECHLLSYDFKLLTDLSFFQGLMRSWIEESLDIYKVR